MSNVAHSSETHQSAAQAGITLDVAAAHRRVREGNPLIQCITNTVVQQVTANILLSVGASPAMADNEGDAAAFAQVAGGLLVNFGTPTPGQFEAGVEASATMTELGKPWVVDPVGIGAMPVRSEHISALIEAGPTIVRGNASEIAAAAGAGAGARGVDSTDSVEAVVPAAIELARRTGGVVTITGAADAAVAIIAGQPVVVRIGGGDELMTRVIGTGCALGATCAAYLAAAQSDGLDPSDPAVALEAAVAAHAHFKAAGSLAAQTASAPGSYAVALVDAFDAVTDDQLAATLQR